VIKLTKTSTTQGHNNYTAVLSIADHENRPRKGTITTQQCCQLRITKK